MSDQGQSQPAKTAHGVLAAFWAYENALMADDLPALDGFFADGEETTRGDESGLLHGHQTISAYRAARGGAPPRLIESVNVRTAGDGHALVTAVTAPHSGGHGLQTQLWRRDAGRWVIVAAHVSGPPKTFDSRVWRLVGDPLVSGGTGPLAAELLAVKDVFSVAGQQRGAGVPAFLSASAPAAAHATAVQRLLGAGAGIRGITQTDQFAYSLAGDNRHYGTPPNAVVAGGLPGGSTSGGATVVALGAASIGLGTDTAGSIRVPASYQGLWGLRTTHGAVPTTGMLALAPDFDTVGLLTRTGSLLARAARALLSERPGLELSSELLVCPDLQAGLPPAVRAAFEAGTQALPFVGQIVLPDTAAVAEAFRIHQGRQAWAVHGQWLTAHPQALAGAAAERFRSASAISAAADADAVKVLTAFRRELESALGTGVLMLPSAASTAPRLWDTPENVNATRASTLRITCLAAVLGRPAVSVPMLGVAGAPLGVGLIGPPDSDLAIIELGQRLASTTGVTTG